MSDGGARREPIAIVGIGCRLPGGIAGPNELWQFLCNGGDAIGDIPADRWDVDALYGADPAAPGKTYVRRGGFLDGIDQFDPEFFGISPREAAHIDPQQRLLLETAHEAMEDAGERWSDPQLRRTGVFAGVFIHDYQHMQFADRSGLGAHTGTGTAMSIVANRISYCFDLHGPSIAVDTACSSALVAIDMACKALRGGQCDFALAGGVNVILKPEMTIAMSKAMMLSKDGQCRSFDAAANGYVRGEGAGMVLLRPLSAALAAGNTVYASIIGSGVNSDGRTKGISVPSGEAQERLSREVLREAGIAGSDVQYVEAHGTGTPVGDPIEATALGRVFGAGRTAGDRCLLGSIKTNLGHLESASGVVGLIKAALCVHHAHIPPSLHFQRPNPAIDFDGLNIEVATVLRSWPHARGPRRVAVNSFGFGGTNAHAVLEQAPRPDAPASTALPGVSWPRLILATGAHSAAALRALAAGYAEQLSADPACVNDLVYTVSRRRSHGPHRACVSGETATELEAGLRALAAAEVSGSAIVGSRLEELDGRPVFVFSGMGPQWWRMGRDLLLGEHSFREEVERVDRLLHPLTGWSIVERLSAHEADSLIQRTEVAQPAIFAIQVGLTALLRRWGVEPAATIGHSVGEAAALHAAGILTLEDAVTVIYHRSRLQSTTAGTGGMLAAAIDLARATDLIAGTGGAVAVAAINGPRSLTLSGDTRELDRIRRALDTEGVFARALAVDVAYHSSLMDPLHDELLAALGNIQPRQARCRYYSTTDGRDAGVRPGDAEYWWRNVRQTVRFADAIAEAANDGHQCFLEVGPHPVLSASIRECLDQHDVKGAVVATLRRDRSDFATLTQTLGELHVAGVAIDWEPITPAGRLMKLPRYPWQRSRHWSESPEEERLRKGSAAPTSVRAKAGRHPLLGARLDLPEPTWLQSLRPGEHLYLKDHKVHGQVVFPGAGYLEMAMQTLIDDQMGDARAKLETGECLVVGDVEIGRAFYVSTDEEIRFETRRQGDRWSVHACAGGDGSWARHAAGRCRRERLPALAGKIDLESIRAMCPEPLATDYAYRLFGDVGLDYGPAFRAIQDLWYGPEQALARLQLPAAATGGSDASVMARFLFHPALLDACLHTLFAALNLNGEDSHLRGNTFLPVGLRSLRLYREPPATIWSHARITARASRHFQADVSIVDDAGELIAEVIDLRCQALDDPSQLARRRRQEWLSEYQWCETPLGRPPARLDGQRWLVCVPHGRHPIVGALRARGAECVVVVPGPGFERRSHDYTVSSTAPGDLRQLLSEVRRTGPLTAVVHGFCLKTTADEPTPSDGAAAWAHQEIGAGTLMHLVQALVRADQPATLGEPTAAPVPQLWVLTERTQAVSSGAAVSPAHATVWGLRRVIANEHPPLCARIIDLDGSPRSCEALADELGGQPDDDELAFRDGVRHVHRLRRYVPLETSAAAPPVSAPSRRMELEVPRAGDLRSLRWTAASTPPLGDLEVEIKVEAAGVNFKDVMKASGLFPARLLAGNLWSGETLGMECAGRVARVGAAVRDLVPGEEVMALAPRALASHAITHRALVARRHGLSPTAAAGIPVAFLTAAVGLEHLAGLAAGERVLIHAATGGVGFAAIQIARAIGAEVFATAGSEAKRERLRAMGITQVFDSRSLRFAEEIRRATGDDGVDVVLNSLPGDAITEGVAALNDYGRFIEIGKMDLDRDFLLGLRPFGRCLSFHSVDLDRMLAQRVPLCGRIFADIADRLAQGRLQPLPVTAFDAGDTAEAFHLMATANHVGKLVIDLASRPIEAAPSGRIAFKREGSYVVSGGLGGFGLQLACWLAAHGAGRVVLLGRRGCETPGASAAAQKLQALGAEVQIEACDIADADAVAGALSRIPVERPLRGVFHAAAVLDDALLENLDLTRYRRTFAPKALGAWNLHQATLDHPLDHFMCFSSMASVLGNQGSANYCAANAFVDALAHYRRSLGRPALTVNWGVIADVGMAAEEDFYRQNLERNGLRTIHSRDCLDLLELLLHADRVQTTVCPIDFETWLRFNPAGKEGRLREIAEKHGPGPATARVRAPEEVSLRESMAPLDPGQRLLLAEERVRAVIAAVLRTDVEKVDRSRSLVDLGVESLLAIEIKNRLEALGLAVSVTQILNRATAATLAGRLLAALGDNEGSAQAPADAALGPVPQGSPWFARRAPRPDARVRLFCFPYAGGTSAVYNAWTEELPDWIEVVAVCLPARGPRSDEANIESICAAAEVISREIEALLDKPFALFGHCMGAILMFEVAQRLQAEPGHARSPVHIFASGCMAPHLYNSPVVNEQDDATFLDVLRLISFSATRALLDDSELRTRMFPMLRGDFRAVVEYGQDFRWRPPLSAPITGIAGSNDLFAAPKAMAAWDRYTSGGYDLAQLEGDHYFVESDRQRVLAIVGARLAASAGVSASSAPAPVDVVWSRPLGRGLGDPPLASEASNGAAASACPPTAQTGPVQVLCFAPAGMRGDELVLPAGKQTDLNYATIEWRGPNGHLPRTIEQMVDHAHAAVRGRHGRTLLYGHCLGAIVAYELALRLWREGHPLPEQLLVTGTVGPHLYVAPNAHQLPTEKLLELLGVLHYPFIDRLRRDRAFLDERQGLIRADLEAMASYQYHSAQPLPVPITAISFRHDLWSYPLRTKSWRDHTGAGFRLEEWPGDHYGAVAYPERVDRLIRSLCQ